MSTLRRARARLRMSLRRRPDAAEASREAGRRTARGAQWLWNWLRRIGRRLAPYITAVLSLPIVLAAQVVALASRLAAAFARRVDALSAIVRPELAVAGVAAACCVALGASQFVAYTGVAVDAPGYNGGIGRVAPAPITGAKDIGTAHAYLMLPLAAVALVLTGVTLRGRWRMGRLVALCGLIAVLVSLLVDMPQGIDAGRAGVAYQGSEARLLEGFWAQLAAGSALLICGALLGSFVRRAQEGRSSARPRPRERARRNRRLSNPLRGARNVGNSRGTAGRSRWRTS